MNPVLSKVSQAAETWDLVNTSLMRRHIESGDPAVIGLLRYMSKAKGLSKELR